MVSLPPPAVESHRRALRQLTSLAGVHLRRVTAGVMDPANATGTRDALLDTLPPLVTVYGAAAATLAADWYDEARAAKGLKSRFRAVAAELPDKGRTDALARWATTPLFSAEPDAEAATTLLAGGFQRIVANADRQTIVASSIADPGTVGWERSTSGNGCAFCAMLAERGAVYTEATADFASHDHCHCLAVPAFH